MPTPATDGFALGVMLVAWADLEIGVQNVITGVAAPQAALSIAEAEAHRRFQ
jgi:hypothetical protein